MPVRRNGKWYGRVSLNGLRKEKKFPTKRDAVAWEVAMKDKKSSSKSGGGILLHVLIDKYVAHCEKLGQSKKHVDDKERTFLTFLKVSRTARTSVDDLEYETVQETMNEIAEKMSPHRANVHLTHLNSMWNWGMKRLRIPQDNPFLIERYTTDKAPVYVPPVEDFWKLIEVLAPHEERLVMAFLYTSARRNELLALKWDAVELKNKVVFLDTRKRKGGGLHRDPIPMAPELVELLQAQRLETGFKEYVFICHRTGKPYGPTTKVMNNWCKKAGLEKSFNFHAIRHLSASVLVSKGYSLTDVQSMLRHKNTTTTQKYVHSLGFQGLSLEGAFDAVHGERKVSKKVSRTKKRVNG
ncbi:tyrosine-type recombinase/integrase [Maridesulfovibrio sp.]|uniref:tyrosine-type recombinase/integrase n=1 Tax=Maridesulfovibrio sp. TaxID=2795000 RepID=UPI003BAA7F47